MSSRNGNETITIYKGVPCVKWDCVHYDKPEKTSVHWPIGMNKHLCVDLIGNEVWSCGNGMYKVRRAPFYYIQFALVDYGKTQSIGGETVEILRPKTRVECRWKDGRWEKNLKARGWVSA